MFFKKNSHGEGEIDSYMGNSLWWPEEEDPVSYLLPAVLTASWTNPTFFILGWEDTRVEDKLVDWGYSMWWNIYQLKGRESLNYREWALEKKKQPAPQNLHFTVCTYFFFIK